MMTGFENIKMKIEDVNQTIKKCLTDIEEKREQIKKELSDKSDNVKNINSFLMDELNTHTIALLITSDRLDEIYGSESETEINSLVNNA